MISGYSYELAKSAPILLLARAIRISIVVPDYVGAL
jgi:hypothetical protein